MKQVQESIFIHFFELGKLMKQRMGECIGMTLPQVAALHFIAEQKPLMRELAEHLKIKAPSATALANELVRMGFVKRAGAPLDRRQIALALTAEGRRSLAEIAKKRRRVITEMLAGLSERDRRDLDRILVAIIKARL